MVLVILLACIGPHLGSTRSPSLFDDDLIRVGALRRGVFPAALFQPFNEHLAPLFELVSWLGWWAAGRDVERLAASFHVASFAAWGATSLALAAVVRRELRSSRAAAVALIGFGLSPVAIETVLWYSASSFQWAAAAGLVGWYAAASAVGTGTRGRRIGWTVAAALAALASPLFSAIGVLAGPLAAARLLFGGSGIGSARARGRWWWVAAAGPGVGTLAYLLLVAAMPRHGSAVAASVREHIHLIAAASAVFRAPAVVLGPGLLGLPPGLFDRLPDAAAATATIGLAIGIVGWATRSPHRGLILTALGWVAGGYALAYLARAVPGDRWVFAVGRYHLFPLIGAACWLAVALGPALDRVELRRPLAGWGLVALLAVLASFVQGPRVAAASRASFRYPDQPRSITAALRLEAACRLEGVPLAQAIRIVAPARRAWFPRPLPFHPLLYLFDDREVIQHRPDAEARARILGRLSWDDRRAIWGGLEVDPAPAGSVGAASDPRPDVTSLFSAIRGQEAPPGEGLLCFEEFAAPAARRDLDAMEVAGLASGTRFELWWAGSGEPWGPARSVRCLAGASPVRLDLGRWLHWRPAVGPLRIRLVRRNRPFELNARPTLIFTSPG